MQGDNGTDLVASGESVKMVVYAEESGEVTLKLESGSSFIEVTKDVFEGRNELEFDVSTAPANVTKAVVFPDLGAAADGQTIYIDNISFPGGIFVPLPEGTRPRRRRGARTVTGRIQQQRQYNPSGTDMATGTNLTRTGTGQHFLPATDLDESSATS